MEFLLLLSALHYLSAAPLNPGGEIFLDDESLLRAMEREPARVVAYIRAQQRRIEWLEQLQVAQEADLQPSTSHGRQVSGAAAELELKHESLGSIQRAVNTLSVASSDSCHACTATCYSQACQGGEMSTDGPFAQCAGVPRATCDMYACACTYI